MSDISDNQIELWAIEKLKPYAKNAKIHDKEKVKRLARSIKDFGWNGNPILIRPDGTIVAGHGRRLAAMELGLPKVPVVVLENLTTDAEADAFRLVDNQVAIGKYDTDLLGDELRRLVLDLDVDMSGFYSETELKFALDDLGTISLDEIAGDLSEEVEASAERTADKLTDEKEKKTPVAEILGFKEFTSSQKRVMGRFNLYLKSEYPNKKPAEAFIAAINQYMDD